MMDVENEIFEVMVEFLRSSVELRDAAALCDDDPVKQDMIAFIVPDFNKMWARSEGIKLMVNGDYGSNKNFIIEEMKIVTKQNLEIASKIKNKLGQLIPNENFN